MKGLVLKETITKESDRVLTILTNDGLMSLYAKAAKNIKSKKFSATNLLCFSEFILREGQDLHKVIEAEDIDIFYELREDIEKISLAHYFCELLLASVTEFTDTENILRLTLNCLYYLCKNEKSIY